MAGCSWVSGEVAVLGVVNPDALWLVEVDRIAGDVLDLGRVDAVRQERDLVVEQETVSVDGDLLEVDLRGGLETCAAAGRFWLMSHGSPF